MTRLLLLGSQVEEIDAVIITLYKVTDEKDALVCGANSKHEAEQKAAKYAARYPEHRFYISNG